MPKPYTYPTILDDVKKINITDLKKWGYLQNNISQSGELNWTKNGVNSGSIEFRVVMGSKSFLEPRYQYNNQDRQYKVYLECLPSNLGKGLVWYFSCPETNKRCRILYSVSGYFLHREAFSDCMYDSQTRSKSIRNMEAIYGSYFDLDKLYKMLYAKNFKKSYAGKPTKKYLKIMRKIKEGEMVTIDEINNLFVFGFKKTMEINLQQ